MKSNLKTMIIMILGFCFALSTIICISIDKNAGNKDKSSELIDNITFDNNNLQISKVSGKIHIDNNWTATKSAGICTGNGTYSEPYVIENLVIDGGGSGSCILIENSEVHFKIGNCSLYNSGDYPNAGIQFSYVNNSQLINNSCSSNTYGIYLSNSDNNTLSRNTANNNLYGITLDSSYNNNISENTANTNNNYGIWLRSRSNNNNVSGNIVDNNFRGIYVRFCDYNDITGNTAKNNYVGIYLDISDYNIVTGNTANNNDHGISLFICDSNNVSGNTASYNTNRGIILTTSDNNTVTGNTANNNVYGIYLDTSNYNTISGNTLIGDVICILEVSCTENEFEDNGSCIVTKGEKRQLILGYELFILIAMICITSIIVLKKVKQIYEMRE